MPDGKRAIAEVDIRGTHDIDVDDLSTKIDTREDVRFLGIFHGVVYEYEIFDQYALRRDLERIERYLRAEGYYEAHVYASRVVEKGNKVYVTISVNQGEPILVDSITITAQSPVDKATTDATRIAAARVMPINAVLEEDKFADSEKAALKGLTSSGYAAATVTRHAEVDLLSHRARLTYAIELGPKAKFGPVKFDGLGDLPVTAVRRVFGVEEGKDFSSAEIEDGKQALLDLGVFASCDVTADTSNIAKDPVVPVNVKCQESKIRAFLVGAGMELDALKTDAHIQLGWSNNNFFGGLRKLDIRYKPGIVLYPTRFPDLKPPTNFLYEHLFSVTLTQPGFIEKRTTGFVRAEYNIYPVLLPTESKLLTDTVTGYHEPRGVLGAERKFFGRLLSVAPEYDIQANLPFDYLGKSDASPLLISYIGVSTHLDMRDDPNKPRRGWYLGVDTQFAGGAVLRGDANDIRIQPDVRGYIPLPHKFVIALRGSVGFLLPFNYSKASQENIKVSGLERDEKVDHDYQLLFFRGFFSGGPSSNRGYPLRGISPHDEIPYLSPAGQSAAAGGCNPKDPTCLLPTGGLTLWEANIEVREVISGAFSAAVFCDAGDVSGLEIDIRLNHPHLSCGVGARYDTPVGPIRLDIGYRVPGLQYPKGDRFEQQPPDLFGVLPIAVAFGIGEAF